VQTVAQRLVSLGKPACFTAAELCQLHQFFVCIVEPRLGVEAINNMQSLKETCRSAFVGAPAAPSATQQQLSETLLHMGLSVSEGRGSLPKVRVFHRHGGTRRGQARGSSI
jgi:hypothetical protein